MSAGTSGSKSSSLPVLVLGAGAAYGAFRVALALTTSETAQVQLWGGITGVILLVLLLVARRRGAGDAPARSGRRTRRSEKRAARRAPQEVAADATEAPKQSRREAKAAARAAQQEAKLRGGIDVVPVARPPEPSESPVSAVAATAAGSRPAVFADLTSPDAVGAEQVAGLAQRALAAVSEQLAALDDRPLDAALIAELRRLAARVRRNGDALIVLAGGAPAPVRSGPTDLTIAVGEAVASLDGAERVRLRPLDPAWVDAPVAVAIADVVAELAENALRAAGPSEPVEVFGRSERGGYALAVVDRGPGLAPDARARINARLAGSGEAVSGSGIGFEVIARLAAVNDLRVELAPARGGGLAALVGVPVHRVLETRAIGKPAPAPIPVPPGVEVAAEPSAFVAPPAAVVPDEPIESIITAAPAAESTAAPAAESTAAPAAESGAAVPAPRPNLGLGSFADLHAAAPPTAGVPSAAPAPDEPGVAVAASQWVVPDVSADLLPGRSGKRGRVPSARGETTESDPTTGPAVSWGESEVGGTTSDEGGRSGEDRSDYFDAFRAAADRAREHAGFDES